LHWLDLHVDNENSNSGLLGRRCRVVWGRRGINIAPGAL
jgi:hypothetical protein